MQHIIVIFAVSLFIVSCGQSSIKQKELELKERELALKEKELNQQQSNSSTANQATKQDSEVSVNSLSTNSNSDNSNDPTGTAKKILADRCNQLSNGHLRIVNLNKTDGVKGNVNGVEIYKVSFTYQVECLKDGGYLHICNSGGKYGALCDFKIQTVEDKWDCYLFLGEKGHAYNMQPRNCGYDNKSNFDLVLEKHESGWVKSNL